jgi:hypothetical protein
LQLRLEFFLERFASALSERCRRGSFVAPLFRLMQARQKSQILMGEFRRILKTIIAPKPKWSKK